MRQPLTGPDVVHLSQGGDLVIIQCDTALAQAIEELIATTASYVLSVVSCVGLIIPRRPISRRVTVASALGCRGSPPRRISSRYWPQSFTTCPKVAPARADCARMKRLARWLRTVSAA